MSPPILDFLEEDIFAAVAEDMNHQRIKFKSEFVKRDRQESEDSNAEADSQLTGDAEAYLNSKYPNNSIKFTKSSQSVSCLFY